MSGAALVVLAHPSDKSLSRQFAQTSVEVLTQRGFAVQLLDLNACGFDPVLSRSERDRYYASESEWDETGDLASQLQAAKVLVLCFPTWWFGLPAVLKGWIDRVFMPGVAFDHADNFGPIRAKLSNLKHVVVVTTLGSPWWVDHFIMRRPVRRVLKTAVFGLCAPKARFHMLSLYNAENPGKARINTVEQRLSRLLRGI